jgi:hypothetical protein
VIKIASPKIAESEVLTTMHSRSSRFTFSSLFVLSCAALGACSGEIVEIGAHDQGLAADGGGGGADGSTGDGGGGGGGGGLPTCEAPSGPVHEYTSIADTEARVAGTWLLCSGGIGSPADTAGIDFAPGKAHFLQKVGDTLVNGPGADYERNVAFVDTTAMNGPGAYQINLSTAVGTNMYTSRASEDGRFLDLYEGTSGKQARYVRVPAKPACSISGAPHAYRSIADVAARIKGKWAVCSGGITGPADTKGLEFDGAADAWFLIDSSGSLVRGPGWDYERDVQIIDTTSMNGAGWYQINLKAGAGTNMYFSRVSEAGDVLELDEGTSGKKVVYKRIP